MIDKSMESMEGLMASARYHNIAYWLVGFGSLIVGGYLIAGYAGALIAVGLISTALAVAQEIKSQIYPIGVIAIKQLAETTTKGG